MAIEKSFTLILQARAFEQVANIAKRMVKEWGMSDKIGRVALSDPRSGGKFCNMHDYYVLRPCQIGNLICTSKRRTLHGKAYGDAPDSLGQEDSWNRRHGGREISE